ncbi:MAG: histidine phosphatase family protein [Spirochaetales bacterium]|nr:histidine phosphatase family protein [Spirochaetales bacterium]
MVDLRKLEGKGNIYLVRHGESDGCSKKIIKGRRDFPLSGQGRIQAEKTGMWFKSRNIQTLLCSPLKRAAETAEIIASRCGIASIAKLPELLELETGIFSGLTAVEAELQFPRAWRRFKQKSWDGVPEAESSSSLLQRAEAFWEQIFCLVRNGSRNIAAVTHSGIMQWIIKSTLGHRKWLPLFAIDNCAIFMLTFNVDPQQFYCSWDILGFTAP